MSTIALVVLVFFTTHLVTPCTVINVTARRGDTIATIAWRYDTSAAAIRAANRGFATEPLLVGQTISVPACSLQRSRPWRARRVIVPSSPR